MSAVIYHFPTPAERREDCWRAVADRVGAKLDPGLLKLLLRLDEVEGVSIDGRERACREIAAIQRRAEG